MKVIIAGGTGMIGALILEHCLHHEKVSEVIHFVRTPTDRQHIKLNEVSIKDFEDYSTHSAWFQQVHAAFFCIGVYTGQVTNELFEKITVNYAVAFAKAVKKENPKANFCLLSGTGADRTEKSSTAFARFKGMAENQIDVLGLNFYSFRPAYIYPVKPRVEPNLMYKISRALYPLIQLFGKNTSIKSDELARAMFNVGMHGADKSILENRDILEQLGNLEQNGHGNSN